MTETTTEASPGDNVADALNAQEGAANPDGSTPPTETDSEAAAVTAEVGVSTPAAGDGPHQPATVPDQPSDFAVAWMASADEWIHGHLRNSPLAEATQAWNHVMAKLPLLGALVEAKLSSQKE